MMYVGIGSCPHALTLDEITDEWDQILPVFIRKTKAEIIHYDPMFERQNEFMKLYFEDKGFTYMGNYRWTSPLHTVTLISKRIDHPEDDFILDAHIKEALQNDIKLVVQEFTGTELTQTLKAAYEKTKDSSKFKRDILFDITYGTACHCMTNMVKYKPLYKNNGDFINLLLSSDDEILSHIGASPEIDEFIKIRFVRKYLDLVNQQVDYRRRLQGNTVLFPCESYGDTSSPDVIMAYIKDNLRPILNVLDQLGMITSRKQGLLDNLFINYKDYDVYKWNDTMRNIVSK
jgi:hypothetical protein